MSNLKKIKKWFRKIKTNAKAVDVTFLNFPDGSAVTTNAGELRRRVDEFPLQREYDFCQDDCLFPPFGGVRWCGAAQRAMSISNAGGSSELSEALSMQYMQMLFGVTDFVPEMDVAYYIEYKMCDYLMRRKEGNFVGVSVTRAMPFPLESPYTIERARELLARKLYGLVVARNCVAEENPFESAILHIWCYSQEAAAMMRLAHQEIVQKDLALHPSQRTFDSVAVICSVCSQLFIYTNKKK